MALDAPESLETDDLTFWEGEHAHSAFWASTLHFLSRGNPQRKSELFEEMIAEIEQRPQLTFNDWAFGKLRNEGLQQVVALTPRKLKLKFR